LTSGRRLVVKIIAESLSQRDEKHAAQTSFNGKEKKWDKNTKKKKVVFAISDAFHQK
jgi:hypothetical protein